MSPVPAASGTRTCRPANPSLIPGKTMPQSLLAAHLHLRAQYVRPRVSHDLFVVRRW